MHYQKEGLELKERKPLLEEGGPPLESGCPVEGSRHSAAARTPPAGEPASTPSLCDAVRCGLSNGSLAEAVIMPLADQEAIEAPPLHVRSHVRSWSACVCSSRGERGP